MILFKKSVFILCLSVMMIGTNHGFSAAGDDTRTLREEIRGHLKAVGATEVEITRQLQEMGLLLRVAPKPVVKPRRTSDSGASAVRASSSTAADSMGPKTVTSSRVFPGAWDNTQIPSSRLKGQEYFGTVKAQAAAFSTISVAPTNLRPSDFNMEDPAVRDIINESFERTDPDTVARLLQLGFDPIKK